MKRILAPNLIKLFKEKGSSFLKCPEESNCDICELGKYFSEMEAPICVILMEIATQVQE